MGTEFLYTNTLEWDSIVTIPWLLGFLELHMVNMPIAELCLWVLLPLEVCFFLEF